MHNEELLVRFRPTGREVFVLPGTRLIEAAAEADIVLNASCGGEGTCGKCRVIVRSYSDENRTGSAIASIPTESELRFFSEKELQQGWRLACQAKVLAPLEVEVPAASCSLTGIKILETTQIPAVPQTVESLIKKQYVELPVPTRDDAIPDIARLEKALSLGRLEVDLSLMRKIPERLRENHFQVTAVLSGNRLLDLEAGNTTADGFAAAFDIGTTTLVGVLVDLATGSEWAVTSRLNPQTRFGDDVLSRINHARTKNNGLQQLHLAIIEAINEMLAELCRSAGIPQNRIYEITFSGNTTMQEILAGINVNSLGESPFVPACSHGLTTTACQLGLDVHPRAGTYIMPIIGGFVGGDTVSGILATEMLKNNKPTLLVDVGTNGEIVLWIDGQLLAASTAAGPAFEGARISQGMRAAAGAIEKALVDNGKLHLNVIGNVPALGICGSGLIDIVAELLRYGVITPEGRLACPDSAPANLPDDLIERLVWENEKPAFRLVPAANSGNGRDILLRQQDIRELQLAAGAIRAGITILLHRAGITPQDLNSVLLCGGFGNFIRRNNAQRIGLLPPGIAHSHIRYMGNTSLAGAKLVALSQQARLSAEEIAHRTRHVDLSTDVEFQKIFAESMLFPTE